MSSIEENCKRLNELLKEVKDYEALHERLKQEMEGSDEKEKAAKEHQFDQVRIYILCLLESMDDIADKIGIEIDNIDNEKPVVPAASLKTKIIEQKPVIIIEKKTDAEIPQPSSKLIRLDKKKEQGYIEQLALDKNSINRMKKAGDKPIKELARFSVYKPNWYGRVANSFFDKFLSKLKSNNPKMFDNMYKNLRSSDIKILSRTYVNMIFFTTFISFLLGLIGCVTAFVAMGKPLLFGIAIGIFLAFLIAVLAFVIMYAYPGIAMSSRRKMIRNDLPFMIIHMAAVAESGAHPLSIFNLILRSGEYKGLEEEIRRIVNYTNLFGYDLNTALKTVARTTPSLDLKELLNGISTTIESGGNLAVYLKAKAQDSMTKYKLARQKYVETLATYSDIYTGVLIAAPLLFLVTLAIINILGGNIGGLSAKSIATFGTFIVIPFLNIGFIIFLTVTQPEI